MVDVYKWPKFTLNNEAQQHCRQGSEGRAGAVKIPWSGKLLLAANKLSAKTTGILEFWCTEVWVLFAVLMETSVCDAYGGWLNYWIFLTYYRFSWEGNTYS